MGHAFLLEALAAVADESLMLLFVVLVLLLMAVTEFGYRIGRRAFERRAADEPARSGIGFIVGGILGLLAFLLGITLSLAEGRHDERRAVVLDEANAIGTAWLRAGVIGGEEGARMQRALVDYTEVRIRVYRDIRTRADADRLDAETAALQTTLWETATVVARAAPTPISGLMLAALNETFDLAMTQKRYFTERVPPHILRLLLWTSIIAVGAMGYHFGVGGTRQLVMSTLLLVLWASAIVLIIDINRPRQGTVTVSHAPLEWTLEGFGPRR
ncbi:hypothetical protein [Elioraea sp.]|uniref:bestrophin-like domain n=1 Tax=Elioraea sp. TaxID=2185103 RepID=UPI0025BE1140|nr:hypothetical protein [Elioraea sp.]